MVTSIPFLIFPPQTDLRRQTVYPVAVDGLRVEREVVPALRHIHESAVVPFRRKAHTKARRKQCHETALDRTYGRPEKHLPDVSGRRNQRPSPLGRTSRIYFVTERLLDFTHAAKVQLDRLARSFIRRTAVFFAVRTAVAAELDGGILRECIPEGAVQVELKNVLTCAPLGGALWFMMPICGVDVQVQGLFGELNRRDLEEVRRA